MTVNDNPPDFALVTQLAHDMADITSDLEALLVRMTRVCHAASKTPGHEAITMRVSMLGAVLSAGLHCFEQDLRQMTMVPGRLAELYAAVRGVASVAEEVAVYRKKTGVA